MEDEIKKVYNLFIKKQHNDVVKHEEIEKLIAVDRNDYRYYKIMAVVKDSLIPESKIVRAITGVGYQILNNKQVSSYVYRSCIKSSQRNLNKSKNILEHLDTKDFNDDRRNEYNDVKNLSNKLNDLFQDTLVKSCYYSRMDYYNRLKDKEE